MEDYLDFVNSKIITAPRTGFDVAEGETSEQLYPHQRDVVRWAASGGRRALALDRVQRAAGWRSFQCRQPAVMGWPTPF